jgi:transcriptional regulator with XRE-family HTH domain
MFAENLKKIRKARGFTQLDLAKALGVTAGTVGMWEIGKRETAHQTLIKLSKLFDVSIDYLLTGNDFEEVTPKKKRITVTFDIETL